MVYGTLARSAARMLERRHVTRAGVTRIGVVGAVGAAVWFSRADTVGGLAGSAFLAAVLFCDAVRARMRADRGDALTLWLAAMLSQLRECVVYLGLAAGAVLAGLGGAWGWAAGALVALALRDSLLAAHEAPVAASPGRNVKPAPLSSQGRAGGLLGGFAPCCPTRPPRDSDPGLTSRLLGAAAPGPRSPGPRSPGARGRVPGAGPDGAAAAGVRLDGVPPRPREAEPAGYRTAGAGPRRAPGAGEGAGRGAPDARTGALRPDPAPTAPARRLTAFSQPTRFLVIAVTATVWDARVAFVTLIVGCAIAVTGELVDPTARGVRR
ncbi:MULTISPECIES: hypothetical protein [Nocardiopsidaceae]|uniref:Integral membrane protein n=1 Tax=Streptomonospora nanhaiensis TaxID=1323731 RepID=A0ABY6YQT0_9ACTN|nr:hypothetical protein [Streptomonospora nanhaiensis]WAE74436.1 hypothetical protein OUQ99_04775 [Streptomonospora nanhaiensis]